MHFLNDEAIRMFFRMVTDILSPGYIILSLVVMASRHNETLSLLASHGKTATTARPRKLLLTWPSWCWISKRYFAHFYWTGLLSTAIVYNYHHNGGCFCYWAKYNAFTLDIEGDEVSIYFSVTIQNASK